MALEGAHGSGKTTTALALTGLLRSRGWRAEYCEERARHDAFVEDFTLHGEPLEAHVTLHLFAATISHQIVASRHAELVICDKTPANALAYADVLLNETLSSDDRALLQAMRELLRSWMMRYERVFLLKDHYGEASDDPVRAKVSGLETRVESALIAEFAALCVPLVHVATSRTLEERVATIAAEIETVCPKADRSGGHSGPPAARTARP